MGEILRRRGDGRCPIAHWKGDRGELPERQRAHAAPAIYGSNLERQPPLPEHHTICLQQTHGRIVDVCGLGRYAVRSITRNRPAWKSASDAARTAEAVDGRFQRGRPITGAVKENRAAAMRADFYQLDVLARGWYLVEGRRAALK